MADYQDIRGLRVKYLSADPGEPASGEVWYNSTTGTLRSRLTSEAWASAAPIITARRNIGASASSTQTAGIIFGGVPESEPTATSLKVETYDGTSWTETNDMNAIKGSGASAGASQTDALYAGGGSPYTTNGATVETWNGTSWTETTNINTARNHFAGSGTASNCIVFGGGPPYSPTYAITEKWDGSTWTEVADLATSRLYLGGNEGGTSIAALCSGGDTPPITGVCEEWNVPTSYTTKTFTAS